MLNDKVTIGCFAGLIRNLKKTYIHQCKWWQILCRAERLQRGSVFQYEAQSPLRFCFSGLGVTCTHTLVPIWHTICFLKPTTNTFADATIPLDTTSTCKQDIQYVRCTIAVMVQGGVCLKTNVGTLSFSEMDTTALTNRQKSNNIGSGRKCWVPT